mgnify:FL=1
MDMSYEGLYRQYIEQFILTQDGKEANGLCPFHKERHPSLSVSIETGLYLCHSCGEKGNAYQFAKAMNHPNPREWIGDAHKKPLRPQKGRKNPIVDLCKKSKQYQNNLPIEWLNENPKSKRMLVGKDKSDRLTFPYFDEDGNVLGVKHHKGENGGKPYWEGDGSCKFYGLQLVEGFDRSKRLIICEGERDCLALLELGFQVTCGSAGAKSIPKDMSSIKGFAEYILLFDNDKAGSEGAEAWAKKINAELCQK